jgi:subtilisin family serine protease
MSLRLTAYTPSTFRKVDRFHNRERAWFGVTPAPAQPCDIFDRTDDLAFPLATARIIPKATNHPTKENGLPDSSTGSANDPTDFFLVPAPDADKVVSFNWITELSVAEAPGGGGSGRPATPFHQPVGKPPAAAGLLGETTLPVASPTLPMVLPLTVSSQANRLASSAAITPPADPGSTRNTAYDVGSLSTTPKIFSESIGGTDQYDYYKFSLSTSSNLNIALTNLNAGTDADLYLYDRNGNWLNASYNNGTSDEALNHSLKAGTYYARVTKFSGVTPYTLALSATAPTTVASNLLPAERDIGPLTITPYTRSSSVGTLNTADVYRFSISEPRNLSLSLTGLQSDVDLRLIRDLNGDRVVDADEVLASSQNGGTTSESLSRDLTSPGEYYIQVFRYSGESNYTLSVSSQPVGPPPPPPTIGPENTINGTLSSTDPTNPTRSGTYRDDYQLTLPANWQSNQPVRARLTSSTFDTYLQVVDAATGSVIASNDDYNGFTNSQVTFRVPVGADYRLRVTSKNAGATGSYTLSTIDNFGAGYVNAAAAVASAIGESIDPVSDTGYAWNLNFVKAPEVWAKGYTGQGVVVAVVDTGVDYNHSDLDANIWMNSGEVLDGIDNDGNGFIDDIRGWDFVANDNNPMDENQHGTHVAGIIAAENNGFGVTGVAYNAKIMPVRVLDAKGTGYSTDIANGIRYAANNGADIINLSLGGIAVMPDVEDALTYALGKGVLVAMAAGNNYATVLTYPARYADGINGLAVGAVDSSGNIAEFSNAAGAVESYVLAPGVGIYSTVPGGGYDSFNGTSMAAPHLAGVAALMLNANPSLSPLSNPALQDILLNTASWTV